MTADMHLPEVVSPEEWLAARTDLLVKEEEASLVRHPLFAAVVGAVLAAVDRGMPRREMVEIFSISLTTLKRWIKMRRKGKDLSPGVSTGRRRRILSSPEEEGLLWEQLEANDDATLQRHCELWEQKTGVRVSVSAMSRAIRQKLGWSYKKDAGCHRARRREKERFQGAPIEDSSDTDSFGLYVREILVPRLKSGQIVLMDNLSVHTSGWARELIEERGCELWLLPAYSPDMNPIEKPSPR